MWRRYLGHQTDNVGMLLQNQLLRAALRRDDLSYVLEAEDTRCSNKLQPPRRD